MKIRVYHCDKGFTLPEVTVGLGIFGLLMACYLSMSISGLRLCRFESMRFSSSSQALDGTSRILMEMRGAWSNRVGTTTGGDATTFTTVPDAANQTGTALQILTTNAPTPWICYYYVANSNNIYRAQSGSSVITVVASSVTNTVPIFQEELPNGTVRTNSTATSITSINLSYMTASSSVANYFNNTSNFLSFRVRAYPRNF